MTRRYVRMVTAWLGLAAIAGAAQVQAQDKGFTTLFNGI